MKREAELFQKSNQLDMREMLIDFIDDEIKVCERYMEEYARLKVAGVESPEVFQQLAEEEFHHAEYLLSFGRENNVDLPFEVYEKKLYGLDGILNR